MPATYLEITVFPATATAGATCTVVVSAKDDIDVIDPFYENKVALSDASGGSSPGAPGGSGATDGVNAVGGVATMLDVVFSPAGTYIYVASDGGQVSNSLPVTTVVAAADVRKFKASPPRQFFFGRGE